MSTTEPAQNQPTVTQTETARQVVSLVLEHEEAAWRPVAELITAAESRAVEAATRALKDSLTSLTLSLNEFGEEKLTLTAKLALAERDSRRLDWLHDRAMTGKDEASLDDLLTRSGWPDLREAIDAAMQPEGGK